MYNCEGQLSIFDYLDSKFCSDSDINELRVCLKEAFKDIPNLIKSEEYEVWRHVPYLGPRYSIYVLLDDYTDELSNRITKIASEYSKKGVELSTSLMPYTGFRSGNPEFAKYKGEVFFSTMFTDKRKKLKKAA